MEPQRTSQCDQPLAGWRLEQLDDEHGLVLSRAVDPSGTRSVLVLAPGGRLPSGESVARLERVHALRDELEPGFATTPRALLPREGGPVLLLDDPAADGTDAVLLSRLVGSPWELSALLRVGCGIAAALGHLHARGLVHKDIRPAHLFVRRSDGRTWLTGFGITSTLPRERQAPAPPEIIAGTLAYMSPEQTGRMNRSIDSRSDLYSLGITLYELLSGALPFSASDPIEWIHCHIAREPSFAIPALEPQLASILHKLLAKNAEDRYQTAAGVAADLRRCLDELEGRGHIAPFALGERDASERLLIPEKLYGRDADVAAIRSAFERVVTSGTSELVLVSGYAGIGKSSLVNELHKLLVPSRSLFAGGKFDQLRSGIPYATIAQAVQSLLREILGKSDRELSTWRERLLAALGPNGRLLVPLIPELALVLGTLPPVPDLPPQEAKNRFRMVLCHLLGAFASGQGALVLFLDDLQWLDGATLELVEGLFTGAPVANLLLIGAYRDNEVGPEHPLTAALSRVRAGPARVSEVTLAPMSTSDVGLLVAESLQATRERVDALARLIHDKTGGNPFFVIQFLTGLADEGLVAYDRERSEWRWDTERVFAKGFTDNVVDFMLAKLERLRRPTQLALRELACLGNATSSATLALVHGRGLEQAIWDAVHAGLVCRNEQSYGFLHDRVQEAAYGLLPREERAREHLRIGRLLEPALSADDVAERIFEVVAQKNRGAALIVDPREREALRTLNVRAGVHAKRAAAYGSARGYFAEAEALLEPGAWSSGYRETFELFLLLSECEYLVGNFARADELFDFLLERARDAPDRARVYVLRMRAYQVAGKYEEGVGVALRALRLFGVSLPEREADIGPAVAAELARVPVLLRGRAIADLVSAPRAAAPEVLAVVDLLSEATPCAYIGRPPLFPLIALRALNVSLEHGNTEQSAYNYGIYAVMLVGLVADIPAAFEFSELSLALNDRFANARLRGTLLHLHGDHIRFWQRPFAEGIPILERAFGACLEVGDLVYAGFLAFETVWQLIERGDSLGDVLAASERYETFARESHNDPVVETIRLEQGFLKCLQGRTSSPLSFDAPDGSFDEAASYAVVVKATFGCGIFFYRAMKQIVAYLRGRLADALEWATAAESVLGAAMAMPIEATFHFYHALTLCALMPSSEPEVAERYARVVTQKLAKLEVWARHCPENFGARHALAAAELARVEGRVADAARLYEDAVRSARDGRLVPNEALAHELCARFHVGLGAMTAARAHSVLAQRAYARWGALAKVEQLGAEFPDAAPPPALPARATIDAAVRELDLATVVKVSQAVSAEIVLETLMERLLTIAVENAGAERGLLLLLRDGELVVEARATASTDGVEVELGSAEPSATSVPESVLRFVARTLESVILGDAAASGPFRDDAYVRAGRVRSLLCLPLVKQTRLIGVLQLENNLLPGVFTPRRIALLELLASQAAISLENAHLHADLGAAQESLRGALRDNRLIIDTIPALTWCARPDGSVELISQPWLDYTGLSREAAVDWGWVVAFHPEDIQEVERVWRAILASRAEGGLEARLRRHDGVYRWFLMRARPLLDETGQVVRWYGTNADIEELRQTQEKLRRNQAFLVEGQRVSATGSFSWHVPSDEIVFSDETYRIFGFERDEPIELATIAARVHPDDRALLAEKIELARRGMVDHNYEIRLRMPDGHTKYLRTNAYSTRDREGNVEYFGVMQDITERRLAEEAMGQLRTELARMTRAVSMGALTASIAHEVNQPLAGIMTNASTCLKLLSTDPPNVERALETVRRTLRDSKRAGDVIARLRALFGKKDPATEVVDLNEAARDVLALALPELKRNRVVLKWELAAAVPPLTGDRVQLQQVILNLVLNASEAMTGVTGRPRELLIRTERDGDECVRLTVEDAGVGLAPGVLEQLFEAFYTTKHGGMGIGLSVSRSIVESHGGRLWARPNGDRAGATFAFSLPLKRSA